MPSTVDPERDRIGPFAISMASCLVLGGTRSGKSAYALDLARRSGLSPVYLATATVWDDEMRARIDRHRGERDGSWRTVEEPLALVAAMQRQAADRTVVLVDCLTLWLSNVILAGLDAEAEIAALIAAIPGLPGPVVLVSNEVGSGIVPDNALAREFRDLQGRLNQAVARVCDGVILVTAGLPIVLKPGAPPILELRAPAR